MKYEVCVDSIESAKLAFDHSSVKRVEVCMGLDALGGFTPSIALIRKFTELANSSNEIHVLLRNFTCFENESTDVCVDTIYDIQDLCGGYVCGKTKLNGDGRLSIDVNYFKSLRDNLPSKKLLICHRGIDTLINNNVTYDTYFSSIEAIVPYADGILTSGNQFDLSEPNFDIVEQAQFEHSTISFIIGGGINKTSVKKSSLNWIHGSFRDQGTFNSGVLDSVIKTMEVAE